MPGDLPVEADEPDVGGLQRLVEHVAAGCAHGISSVRNAMNLIFQQPTITAVAARTGFESMGKSLASTPDFAA
jgi:hypothetical protein